MNTPIPASEYAIALTTGMGFCVGDCNDLKAYSPEIDYEDFLCPDCLCYTVVSIERAVTEGFIVIVDPKE